MLSWVSSARRDRPFWTMQIAGWSTYGALLMLPWIGKYSVLTMLPNKLAIASTGLLTSSVLRVLYRAVLKGHASINVVLLVTMMASVVGGVAWNALSATLIGASFGESWRALGALEGGLPQLGGPLYHALVLLVWSHAYLGIRKQRQRARAMPIESVQVGATDTRIVARDGSRRIVLEPRQIEWVEADGDFVRLHTRQKSFLIRSTMKQLESALPASNYVRIHRSAIVNVARVSEVLPRANAELLVVLRDGTRLKASRSYARRIRAALAIRPKGAAS